MQGQTVDGDDLNESLKYFADYNSYIAEELPRIPPDYRVAVLKAAERAAAQAMWLSLKDHNDQAHPYAVFNVQAEQAMALQKAFVEVHRRGSRHASASGAQPPRHGAAYWWSG